MEVVMHYKESECSLEDSEKLCSGSLEEFPFRQLPQFSPWFPHYRTTCMLMPQKIPPVVSLDSNDNPDHGPFDPLNVESVLYCDPTPSLLEFKPSVCTEHGGDLVVYSAASESTAGSSARDDNVSKENIHSRTWSICTQKASSEDQITPPSEELQRTLNKCNLNLFHRARWTILPAVCGTRSLEEVWMQLSRLLKHKVLPSCNATIQRDINQIWIFCDLRYCEHIGTVIKSELQLCGRIDLFVRKHGTIFSL